MAALAQARQLRRRDGRRLVVRRAQRLLLPRASRGLDVDVAHEQIVLELRRTRAHRPRVIEHNALVFKRMWRGSMTVSFFTPLFFLASMGLGLGSLVNGRNIVPELRGAVDAVSVSLNTADPMQWEALHRPSRLT